MILRKPYAFLIKHFKFIHLVLTVSMLYLIYRTELMIDFLNEYVTSSVSVMGKPIVETLYNVWVFVIPIFILAVSAVLLVTMTVKKKPKVYYILMVVVHLAVIAVYLYGWIIFSRMQETILDLRTIKALRDVLMYCIIFQSVFSIVSLIRGVGFDIKKFDFGRDLESLDISEADSEEFEVAIDFDLNDKTRKGKKILRYWKYQYLEHKSIFHIGGGIIAAVIVIYMIAHFNIYNRTNSEGTNFSMNGFTLGVEKSYIVNDDYKGNLLGDGKNILVVVEMNMKNNGKVAEQLKTGSLELNIAGDIYHHTSKYEGLLEDLGIVYKDQQLSGDSKRYLLVYEVPAKAINSVMKLGFSNNSNGKIAYVRLKPENLIQQNTQVEEYALGETVNFKDSTLGDSTLQITNYELRNRFTLKYRYCSSRSKTCVDSVEYLTPNLFNSNYDKTLLKIDANINFKEDFYSENVKNIYDFLKVYGKIEYELDGKQKTQNVYFGDVKPSRVKSNSYYIEVMQEIKAADRIVLVFQIRDNVYRYYLK